MSYQKRRRPMKGGKVEVKYLNKLLKESYKGKNKTSTNIDDGYILDNELLKQILILMIYIYIR